MRRRFRALPWMPALLLLGATPAPHFVERPGVESAAAPLAEIATAPRAAVAATRPRPGIDIDAYRFELTLRDDSDRIAGRATVRFRFTADGVAELALDLVGERPDGLGMEVTEVTSAGRRLEYRHENDLLTVRLPGAGRTGALDSLTVDYRGAPASGLRIGPNKYGERTFFSDNWPNRARNWLPTVDHVAEKAACEFVVTAPAHYQVVSNGVVVEQTDLAEGMRRTHWRQSAPISPWLFVVGVARFAVQNLGEFDGKPVQTWVYARDRDAGFHDFAVPTLRVLAFFDDYVGPFAYDKLANITSPATGGGMEAATALMYSENAVTGDRPVRWRNVVIHEIAHQWFGNAVTESEWDDVWLSEGFATYFTLLFREHAYGRDDFVAGLRQAAERVVAWYEANPDYRIVHDGLEDMSRVTSVATYQKGAWVLHMLRRRVGDEAFQRGIRAYYARHLNGTASTDDLMRAMEEASGDDLRAFFDQWLRHGGNPVFEGSWTYDADAGAVRVDLRQAQETGLFRMPLDIGVYIGRDSLPARVVTVEVDAASHSFVVPVEGEPSDVRLDPDTWALFEAEFERSAGGA